LGALAPPVALGFSAALAIVAPWLVRLGVVSTSGLAIGITCTGGSGFFEFKTTGGPKRNSPGSRKSTSDRSAPLEPLRIRWFISGSISLA
jgi:hypothetical protein